MAYRKPKAGLFYCCLNTFHAERVPSRIPTHDLCARLSCTLEQWISLASFQCSGATIVPGLLRHWHAELQNYYNTISTPIRRLTKGP